MTAADETVLALVAGESAIAVEAGEVVVDCVAAGVGESLENACTPTTRAGGWPSLRGVFEHPTIAARNAHPAPDIETSKSRLRLHPMHRDGLPDIASS